MIYIIIKIEFCQGRSKIMFDLPSSIFHHVTILHDISKVCGVLTLGGNGAGSCRGSGNT